MSEGGAALMAVGRASGEERAREAAEKAISSQLLDITIDGARGILFNVTGGPNLTLFEVNQAAAIIKETAHPDVNLIFGAVIDPNLADEVRITVIATGFDRAGVRPMDRPARLEDSVGTHGSSASSNTAGVRARPAGTTPERQVPSTSSQPSTRPSAQPPTGTPNPRQQEDFQRVMNTDDLDIPAFLRNRTSSNRS
jgi:cell division protein FtsZ